MPINMSFDNNENAAMAAVYEKLGRQIAQEMRYNAHVYCDAGPDRGKYRVRIDLNLYVEEGLITEIEEDGYGVKKGT